MPKCKECKAKFEREHPSQTYCTKECFKAARNRSIRERQKEYEIKRKKKIGNSLDDAPSKILLKCKVCFKRYERPKSQVIKRGSNYCSKECRYEGTKTPAAKKRTLDALWSEKVKKRDGYKCVVCGKDKYLNSHHIFSRSNHALRWYMPNGISLCPKHHTLGTYSAHKAPLEFGDWIRKRNGDEWYKDLLVRSRNPTSKIDMASIKKELEAM